MTTQAIDLMIGGPGHKQKEEATMARRTVNLTETDLELLEQLKEHFDASSLNDAIRRSIAQSSLLKRYSDENGELVVLKDKDKFIVPAR